MNIRVSVCHWKKRYCFGGDRFHASLKINFKNSMRTILGIIMAWRVDASITILTSEMVFFLLRLMYVCSCMKIITGNHPGPNDHHGCPFRHFSADKLRRQLMSMIPATLAQDETLTEQIEKGLNEVLELVKGGHYQIACTRFFELQHGVKQGSVETITHPNQYFEQAYKLQHPDVNDDEKNGIGSYYRNMKGALYSHTQTTGTTQLNSAPMEVDY